MTPEVTPLAMKTELRPNPLVITSFFIYFLEIRFNWQYHCSTLLGHSVPVIIGAVESPLDSPPPYKKNGLLKRDHLIQYTSSFVNTFRKSITPSLLLNPVFYSQRLIQLPQEVEALAQHFAQLLIRKRLAEKTPEPSTEEDQDFHSVNVNGIASSETKFIGPEHVGLEAMRSLGFFDLFGQLGFTEAQCNFATLLIVGRLVHPSSERELSRYATEQSGLDELLQSSFSHIGQNALYRASDLLIDNKETIERFLRRRSKDVFSLKETIILYDLTNTYFAGEASAYEKAKRGKSKQKRSDRPLVTLGLVLDEEGFLKESHILEGNVSEPSTLLHMVRSIQEKSIEQTPPLLVSKPTVVVDAGIASNANIELLKEEGFSYIVVSRSNPKELPKEDFIEIKEGIKAKSIRQGQELFLHCLSEARMQKEKAMVAKARDRMERELTNVSEGLNKKG